MQPKRTYCLIPPKTTNSSSLSAWLPVFSWYPWLAMFQRKSHIGWTLVAVHVNRFYGRPEHEHDNKQRKRRCSDVEKGAVIWILPFGGAWNSPHLTRANLFRRTTTRRPLTSVWCARQFPLIVLFDIFWYIQKACLSKWEFMLPWRPRTLPRCIGLINNV